jgi:hypothetical protein
VFRTQSTKRAAPAFGSLEKLFDFVFFRADAMSFVPVNLCLTNRTIRKLDISSTLQLSPASAAIALPESLAFPDRLPEAITSTSSIGPTILKSICLYPYTAGQERPAYTSYTR